MRLANRIALLTASAGWLATTSIVVALLVGARSTALERGERAAAAVAEVLEQHTARTFQSAALTVAAVSDTWALSRPRKNDPSFQALLQQRRDDLPYARALFALGPDGYLIHDTDYPRTPDVSLADRSYFTAFRDDPGLESHASGPHLSRSGDGWFVSVATRLGAAGEFQGVVVAALPVTYFEVLYDKIALGDGDVIALFHGDGTLIARHPPQPADIGTRFGHLPLFSARAPDARGTYRFDGHLVPGKRLVAFRSVERLPFVVYVSRSEHALLAEWRRLAWSAGVATAALTLVLAVVLVQQVRRRNRFEGLRAQRAQAEKLEALGQLTGGIAHDFANLLHVVSASLQLIALRPGEREQVLQAAAIARRAADRGAELIARLLAFARRQPLELRPADLNSLVSAAHPLIAQASGARIELVLQLAPGLPAILTDESQLEIALLNLVVNACDAMSGKGRISLRTHAAASGEVCLTVEDDGPGMSEKVRLRALEPFFTTKGDAGTGLGLSQVYGFMRQTGGSVELDSSPGAGTRVHLRFAATAAAARATRQPHPETPERVT